MPSNLPIKKRKMFTIDNIKIELSKENDAIRLITDNGDNVILPNQTMAFVENIVKENYQIVKSYYQAKASRSIDERDLHIISLKIVLYYLYMYNMWRKMYEKEKFRDLRFANSDFAHPATHDMIISHFKNKYPNNYSTSCEILFGMSADEFKTYEKRRERVNNR